MQKPRHKIKVYSYQLDNKKPIPASVVKCKFIQQNIEFLPKNTGYFVGISYD
jgi:hypothetical protein